MSRPAYLPLLCPLHAYKVYLRACFIVERGAEFEFEFCHLSWKGH